VVRPSKPDDERLGEAHRVRYTPGEEALVKRAANAAGLGVAPWIRSRTIAAALEELGEDDDDQVGGIAGE